MDRPRTHRHTAKFHWCFSQDDKNEVFSFPSFPPLSLLPLSLHKLTRFLPSRFGETLPQAPNILQVTPFENTNRHLRNVSDYPSYKKLHSTLPAAVLAALKTRVRTGEPKAIQELWDNRDKTFLAIDFEWSERNQKSCLEWGYAAVRCGHLEACVLLFFFMGQFWEADWGDGLF
jgi:hypothetical protein